jgi:transmembrane sensor
MHENFASPDAMAEAERWFARLKAPDCTAAERLEFQVWRAVPEHAAAYAAAEKLWQSLGKLEGRPDLGQLSRLVLAETAERPRRRQALAMAASVLLAVAGGAVFLSVQHREAPAVVYLTKPGERSIVKLADGSQLVLNYATEVEVRLGKDVRRLTLRKGEALFTVAHDGARPFKVSARDGVVTALGTRFEVRSDSEDVAVTLLEGRIAVDRGNENEHTELHPGDQVRYTDAEAHMSRRVVDPEVVASWSTGRLRFRATPLAEALDEVNRYSAMQIHLEDPDLSSTPVSGTFEVGDSASVISALSALLPIQSEEKDGEILLRRRK